MIRWSFYVLLGIFLRATILLETINSLRLTINSIIFSYLATKYLDILAFVFILIYILDILTSSKSFSSFLWPFLIKAEIAKGANIISTCARGAILGSFCARSTYSSSSGAVKHLRIYLQLWSRYGFTDIFFQLKTEVRAVW